MRRRVPENIGMDRVAWYEPTKTHVDFEQKAHQAYIQSGPQGFSVFNMEDQSYLLTFRDLKVAEQFKGEYDAANMRRKGVSKVWMRYMPMSEDKGDHVKPESKVLKMPDPHEVEQQKRDLILAPQTLDERKEKFRKLKNEGLPHVPEVKEELEKFRTQPARPHGRELPAPGGVPDLRTVEEIMREKERSMPSPRSKVAAWLAKECRYSA